MALDLSLVAWMIFTLLMVALFRWILIGYLQYKRATATKLSGPNPKNNFDINLFGYAVDFSMSEINKMGAEQQKIMTDFKISEDQQKKILEVMNARYQRLKWFKENPQLVQIGSEVLNNIGQGIMKWFKGGFG